MKESRIRRITHNPVWICSIIMTSSPDWWHHCGRPFVENMDHSLKSFVLINSLHRLQNLNLRLFFPYFLFLINIPTPPESPGDLWPHPHPRPLSSSFSASFRAARLRRRWPREGRKMTNNNSGDWWEATGHSSGGTGCLMVYPGLNHWGGGVCNIGDLAYFTHRGFPSAQSDITRCNSARGIIDLSVGSRHQSRCSAAAGVCGKGRSLPQQGLVSADWCALFGLRTPTSTVTRRTWTLLFRNQTDSVGELLANSLSISTLAVIFWNAAAILGCSFSDHKRVLLCGVI